MTRIPTLVTERLRLRAPRMGDFDPYAAFCMSDRPAAPADGAARARAWGDFAAAIGLWALRGYGAWSIEDRATDAYLGEVGLFQPIHYPEPELGWMVVPAAEGRGIAHEAALAARAWAWQARGLGPLVSYVEPANDRSIRLARRLGAVLDAGAALPAGDGPCLAFRQPLPAAAERCPA